MDWQGFAWDLAVLPFAAAIIWSACKRPRTPLVWTGLVAAALFYCAPLIAKLFT